MRDITTLEAAASSTREQFDAAENKYYAAKSEAERVFALGAGTHDTVQAAQWREQAARRVMFAARQAARNARDDHAVAAAEAFTAWTVAVNARLAADEAASQARYEWERTSMAAWEAYDTARFHSVSDALDAEDGGQG